MKQDQKEQTKRQGRGRGSKQTVRAGVFRDRGRAERALAGLIEAGFPRDSLSVVCSQASCDFDGIERVQPAGSRTPEATAAGSVIGSILGGLTVTAGVVATGGTGLLVLGSLLAGAAAGGVTGGFIGAMTTRGFEPEIADFYDQALNKGQILVAVEASEEGPSLERAEEVFERAGVEAIPLRSG